MELDTPFMNTIEVSQITSQFMYTIRIYHRYIMIYNYIKILYGVAMGSLNESPGANWYQYDLLIDSMRKLILASSSCLSVQAQGGGR